MSITDTRSVYSEPVLYRIAKGMERRRIRGSTRFLSLLEKMGQLRRPVDFRISDSIAIRVPISRNPYDSVDVDGYESDLLAMLAREVKQVPQPLILIDVGGDIGLFSLKTVALCPTISRVIAFEPNSEGFPWLQFNLRRLPKGVTGEAVHAAVADFHGRGRLAIPERQFSMDCESNHTQYFLEPSADGDIEVTTVDSLKLRADLNVVIKIDVEGGELAALRGAAQTISTAPHVLVIFEAHPAVMRRTGIDPAECLRFLASLRPFSFFAGETSLPLSKDRAVFDQLAPDRIYNVIARSQ